MHEQLHNELEASPPPDTRLPRLGVYLGAYGPMVSAAFAQIPGFTCDSWCYESEMEYLGARLLDGGGLELHHRFTRSPQVEAVTAVTPHCDAVEFLAHLRIDPGGDEPESVAAPNLCWQLKRAATFASEGAHYTEFVKRCFLFTEAGRTFLHDTDRKPVPPRPLDDPAQQPFPWVQMYLPVGVPQPQVAPQSWSEYSDTRYVTRVIGVASKDGAHLAAIANDTATTMCQAWHDCMHNNAAWSPADAPLDERRWRVRLYAMQNDPDALLDRVRQDLGTEA